VEVLTKQYPGDADAVGAEMSAGLGIP